MKHTDTDSLQWLQINVMLDNLDCVELAENLSYDNLVKLENAYLARVCQNNFEDEVNIQKVVDLVDYLSLKDEEDHSKYWYADRLAELINAGYDIDTLEKNSKWELFDMVYNTEHYAEIAEAKRLEQGPEREL